MSLTIYIVLTTVLVVFLWSKWTSSVGKYDKLRKKTIIRNAKNLYTKHRAVPNHDRILISLVEQFQNHDDPRRWEYLLDVGDMYARGFYPYLQPNEAIAKNCYNAACQCPNAIVRGQARSKILELQHSPILSPEDRSGKKMNPSFGISIVDKAGKEIRQDSGTEIETRNTRLRKQTNTRNTQRRRRHDDIPQRVVRRIGGGNQNTHDHGVTSATKMNISSLQNDFLAAKMSFRPHNEVVDEVLEYCKIKCQHLFARVYEVVVTLSSDVYSDTGVSQIQILDMVLWKISEIPDCEVRESVRETLCKRLASGIENGIVVCGTGKVSRVISVFEGVLDNVQKGISMKLVEKEIAQLAAKIREDFLKSVGPLGREAYERDAITVPEYSKQMSNILHSRAKEEYVDKLNMSESIVHPIVQVYASAY